MNSQHFARKYWLHPRYGGTIRNSIRLVLVGVLAALTASIFPVIADHNPGPEVSPELIDGNAECQGQGGQPDLVKPGQNWLEAKDDSPPFTSATGPGGFVATITHTNRTVDWTANMAVDGVLTKPGGGQDGRSHFYRYDDPTVSPNDDVPGTPNDPGELESDDGLTWTGSTGLSHVTFCYDLDPNLKVQKSASASSVDSGGDVSFRVDATNAGGAAATGVSVTDDLDDGLTAVAATFDNDPGTPGGGGNCTVESGNKVVCAVGDLAATDGDTVGAEPDTASVFIQAKASTEDCGAIVNSAQVSGTNEPESLRDDNSSNEVSVEVRCPDVEVDKSSSATSVEAGGAFTFVVTGSNSGEAAATGVQVTDDLEDDLADVSASFDVDPNTAGGTGTCSVDSGNKVTCNVGTLGASDTNTGDAEPDVVSVTISARAPSQRCDDIDNVASISATNEPSGNRSNNSSGSPVTVGIACADVVASKSSASSAVDAGGQVSYTVSGTNQGDASAHSVSITDNLDDRFINVSASYDVDPNTAGGTGTCSVASGNEVTCNVGTLAASDGNTSGAEPDAVVVSISAVAPTSACGTVPNQASIASASEPSGNQGNNQTQVVNVTVRCADLSISKGASSSSIAGGSSLSYTITARNDGAGGATGVVVTDDLDDDLTNVSASFDVDPGAGGGTGNCSITSGNVVRCDVGNLAASDGNTAAGEPDTVVVTINTTGPTSCQTMTNQASVSASNEPSSAASNNNSNQVNVTVECVDVAVTKSTSTGTIDAGGQISYTLSGRNDGRAAAQQVVIRDNLDDRLTNVSASYDVDPTTSAGASGSCQVAQGNEITCNVGSLAASDTNTSAPEADSVLVTISATAPATICGTVPNQASIASSNEPSANQGNNQSEVVSVTVRCSDLLVSKAASATNIDGGGRVTYTLTARNNGPGGASGAVIKDNLDDDLTSISASYDVDPNSGGGTGNCSVASGNEVTCNVGSIQGSDGDATGAEPDTVVVTIGATTPQSCQTMTNQASVSAGNEPSSATSNNTSNSVEVAVECADVVIEKSASSPAIDAGGQITYSLTGRNQGEAPAQQVVVTDNLDDRLTNVSATFDKDPATSGDTGNCSVTSDTKVVTCNVGTLGASDGDATGAEPDTVIVTITATAPPAACGNISNRASISSSNEPSANQSNNQSDAVGVTVRCADVTISKAASATSVNGGAPLSYTITVRNDGAGGATGVVVKDNLDDDLTGVSASYDIDPTTAGGTGGCALAAGNEVTCNVGNLAGSDGDAGSPEDDTVVVTINATAPTSCQDMVNRATVAASNEPSSATSNNSSNEVKVTVACADVTVRKSAASSTVNAGQQVTYTVTAVSGGTSSATGVTVKDDLDDDLVGVVASFDRNPGAPGDTGTCTLAEANKITCSVGTLEAADGNSDGSEPDVAVVTITTTAPSDACPSVENVSSISAENEPSGNQSNNTSNRVTVNVVCAEPVAQVVEATVTGVKFRDAAGDGGAKTESDPPLAGWRIFVDYNNNGNHDGNEPFDDTDSNGAYEITGIDPGKYKILEVAQGSWTCTFPNPCLYEETFESGESVKGKNFGNRADVQVAPQRIERAEGAPAPQPERGEEARGREIAATGAPLALHLFAALMLIVAGVAMLAVSRRRPGTSFRPRG